MNSRTAKKIKKHLREKGLMKKGDPKTYGLKTTEKTIWVKTPKGPKLQKIKLHSVVRTDEYSKAKKLYEEGKLKI